MEDGKHTPHWLVSGRYEDTGDFMMRIVPQGCPFISHLLSLASSVPGLNYPFTLNRPCKADLNLWLLIIKTVERSLLLLQQSHILSSRHSKVAGSLQPGPLNLQT